MWYLIVSIPDLCTLTYFDKLNIWEKKNSTQSHFIQANSEHSIYLCWYKIKVFDYDCMIHIRYANLMCKNLQYGYVHTKHQMTGAFKGTCSCAGIKKKIIEL